MTWSFTQSPGKILRYQCIFENTVTAKITATLTMMSYGASVYHLLYMSIQRFLAIRFPILYRRQPVKHVFCHLAIVWFFALSANAAVVFPKDASYRYHPSIFTFAPDFKPSNFKSKYVILFVVSVVVLYFAMALLTGITGTILYARNQKSERLQSGGQETSHEVNQSDIKRDIRTFITILLIQIGFLLAVVPMSIFVICNGSNVCPNLSSTTDFVLNFLRCMGSLSNVIIYSIRDKNFRANAKGLAMKMLWKIKHPIYNVVM
ncbi:uncharacterized protein LOC143446654 [Clavelina lepadiformis]|uniref:uncharacterized protein LOC143446654 n=1 Tax=Clavelina lepadiformis TaxID=159417 RepID=UPI004042F584